MNFSCGKSCEEASVQYMFVRLPALRYIPGRDFTGSKEAQASGITKVSACGCLGPATHEAANESVSTAPVL